MLHKNMQQVKEAHPTLAALSMTTRNAILATLSAELDSQKEVILKANALDLKDFSKEDPRTDRLLLTKARIDHIIQDLQQVIDLPNPLNQVLLETQRPNGLRLKKISVPLGVVGIIYESRPNVTIDVFSLCLKSGNACILKGGKEAWHTNTALVELIKNALRRNNISTDCIYLLPPEREATLTLLHAVGIVDVCIPRGSQALIDFVRSNAKIPVIETGAGVVHTYFDVKGDLSKGKAIIENAKTRRYSVCNALDTLIVHQERLNELPTLTAPLAQKEISLYADKRSYEALLPHYPRSLLHQAQEQDFGKEYLSAKMSIKTVASCEEAILHIRHYSSGHSEAIITEDPSTADHFMKQVDAAVVYQNASTAFTDGGEFGMGMEVGISTQKLHVRGPFGLQALTSTKWLVYGDGQVRP